MKHIYTYDQFVNEGIFSNLKQKFENSPLIKTTQKVLDPIKNFKATYTDEKAKQARDDWKQNGENLTWNELSKDIDSGNIVKKYGMLFGSDDAAKKADELYKGIKTSIDSLPDDFKDLKTKLGEGLTSVTKIITRGASTKPKNGKNVSRAEANLQMLVYTDAVINSEIIKIKTDVNQDIQQTYDDAIKSSSEILSKWNKTFKEIQSIFQPEN